MRDGFKASFSTPVPSMTGNVHAKPNVGIPGEDGGYYIPSITRTEDNDLQFEFSPSKEDMPPVDPVQVELPNSGGNVDLTGYATEQFVRDGYQPKGNYLTEVPSGYATEEFVRNRIAEAELGGEEVDLSGYAQKSEIPTKVSQLQNDKGYLTQHQDISGKLDANKLPEAINTALAQAKASGEFDGKDGVDGKDGQDGYTPQKGIDYFDGQPGKDGVDGKDGADGQPGEKGDKGDKGEPGQKGEQGIQGIPGEKGEKGDTGAAGSNGKDGYSPVRGKDYWTDTDKEEIKSYVDEAILGGVW